jgi:aminoglycoside 2'-N-acetyltransferase I
MQRLHTLIREEYEFGVLSTGEHGFYARLGWQRWRGPSFVMTPTGREATPDDDGGLMVLCTDPSRPVDLDSELVASWREGDVW